MSYTHEYAFDVIFTGALRVRAESEEEAIRFLHERLNCADSNLGIWPNGDPILAELSLRGEPELYEVDGEPK